MDSRRWSIWRMRCGDFPGTTFDRKEYPRCEAVADELASRIDPLLEKLVGVTVDEIVVPALLAA
jgi:hypothetical protein